MEDSKKDAHLNIETVTPDTEKDGQPNDQKHNHRSDQPIADDAQEKPATESKEVKDEATETTEETETSGDDDTAETSTAQEEEPEEPTTESSGPKDGDHPSSDIETVSP